MSILHLGEPDSQGFVRPACGAPAEEPVLTPEELRQHARSGGPVCDRCIAIATARAVENRR